MLGRALASGLLVAGLAGCVGAVERAPAVSGEGLIYAWAGDADRKDADFLAVIDARPGSADYGRVLSTVPVEGRGNGPHHTEYELTAGAELWANGWESGRTFRFDLTDPLTPRLAGAFTTRNEHAFPHSYARLPNGNVLTTFQSTGAGYTATGALVELDRTGEFVRSSSGVSPDVPAGENWTYSLLLMPDVDRVVSTNTRMGPPSASRQPGADTAHQHADPDVMSTHVQVWRLSDLTLLHTLKLPPQDGGHHGWTAEPRRLANGST